MDPLLRASDLVVEYNIGRSTTRALQGVSIDVYPSGYKLGVVGESGSGKTTLGLSMMDLIEPPGRIVGGQLEYGKKNLLEMSPEEVRRFRWREVAMVFQSAMNAFSPVKRTADHIVEVITERSETPKAEAREKALSLLSEVGIQGEHADDFPHELSGGMKQRAMIAMALALSPKLLIADEPTSALDVVVQKQILFLLKREVSRLGLSLVFITHDLPLLRGLVDDVAVMFAGEVVEKGPVSRVLNGPMHPYTEQLVSSLLTLDTDTKASEITSFDFSKEAAAEGCRYRLRCKYAFERCRHERPLLKKREGDVYVACHKYDESTA
ncbi:MAG: ABC transporter ATP-binding protein [Thaumarchaeota archaeon]|nr:ABC transporter ATP-binding protein [Nitrososphaerota archaeon]